MDWALILSAALMGLAGAGHCSAMCGAACAVFSGGPNGAANGSSLAFQGGRLAAYSLAGAVAAASVGALSQWGQAVSALRPIWTLLHLAAIGVGLWLMWHGRQPAWMDRMGRLPAALAVPATTGGWQRMTGPGRSAAAGLAWVALPCGLLQSALVVAALANSAAAGAAAMAGFALTSSLGLLSSAWMLRRMLSGSSAAAGRLTWMVRLAGLMLVAASGWALGHGVLMRVVDWCLA